MCNFIVVLNYITRIVWSFVNFKAIRICPAAAALEKGRKYNIFPKFHRSMLLIKRQSQIDSPGVISTAEGIQIVLRRIKYVATTE